MKNPTDKCGWTPGPWRAWRNNHYWQFDGERDGQIGDVCASNHIYHDGEKINDTHAETIARANAYLVAAAPDLYAALSAMVLNDRHTYRDCHKAALAALAKARGEG